MIVRLATATPRRGITLTEILISILILAVGLTSLATLFPIGLLRLREAQRFTRSAVLAPSAAADLSSRGLLQKSTFINPVVSPWYGAGNVTPAYDPWLQDTPVAFGDWSGANDPTKSGAYRGVGGLGSRGPNQTNVYTPVGNNLSPVPGPGLPVAYDPLWWYQMGLLPWSSTGAPAGATVAESRFGDGTSLGLADASGSGTVASMHGLPRLTNLDYRNNTRLTTAILSTFVSPEDVVWQEANNTGYLDFFDPSVTPTVAVASPSTVIPDLTLGGFTGPSNDWRYTWMFTGQQADAFNDRVFNGDVVIFENRPFSVDPSLGQIAGERTVQAIFGFGRTLATVGQMPDGTTAGVAYGSDNAVLVFWPLGTPDPEIKPGGWIADVTYERSEALARARFTVLPVAGTDLPPPLTPAQRCHWYQVRRVTPPADTAGSLYAAYGTGRYSLIYTTTKLKAKTIWDYQNAVPYHANAALVSPYVIGVVPRTISLP